MRAAILGQPGSGRKTLMTALCGSGSAIGAGRKTVATVKVPDPRIDWLSALFKPRKTTYATLEAVLDDTACDSLAKRLNAVRQFDLFVLVAPAFGLGEESAAAALSDIDDILAEMVLADQMVVEKRLEFFQKIGDKGQERKLFDRLLTALQEERRLADIPFIPAEENLLSPYSFLTRKPVIVVLNIDEEELANPAWREVEAAISKRGCAPVQLCAQLEAEIAGLDPAEQLDFVASVGLSAPASHLLVRSVFQALNLVSFFTVGEDEVRAWPVRRDSPAPVAGGKVHSDIQRGFIRAEVVSYDHFQEAGSLATARRTGRLRTEGKSYIVQDGDIINFLFNV